MPQIFDNLTPTSRLGANIRATFNDHFERVDVATGYIDLRGWDHLGPSIQEKALPTDGSPVARILVGMITPSDAAAILAELQYQVQEPAIGAGIPDIGKAIEQRSRLVKHLRTQLMRGLPTQSGLQALQLLKDQLVEGRVQIKVYTRRPLHGKTYILSEGIHQNSTWGYVGSSNLTAAGLSTNLELNIDVPDNDATAKLSQWFEEQWVDKFSLDITNEIIDLIAESWGIPTNPHHMRSISKCVMHSRRMHATGWDTSFQNLWKTFFLTIKQLRSKHLPDALFVEAVPCLATS